jgi:hypothetical protein
LPGILGGRAGVDVLRSERLLDGAGSAQRQNRETTG